MRPLTLHSSALNNAEYDLYTSSLKDLAVIDDKTRDATPHTDSYYEDLSVGVREARAWLRGRYSAVDHALIDEILRLFSPSLAHADVLTGGQFFAVMRLVMHVLRGAQLDKSLVFVQVQPDLPSPTAPRQDTNPPPVSDPPTHDVNPFHHPLPAPQRTAPPPAVPPKLSTNPFLNKGHSTHDTPARTRDTDATRLPPLPPRKPVIPPPPPRHPPPLHRPVPVPPSNTLIQQSLQATRVAQSLKRAEQRLEQERVLEVLKSSAKPSSDPRVRSSSPAKGSSSTASSTASSSVERRPQLPPRRKLSPPPSTAGSSRSFEQVAYASVSRSNTITAPPHSAPPPHSPTRTPPRPLTDLPPEPPPTHPDRHRKPSALDLASGPPSPSASAPPPRSPAGTSPRVFRSKSMHYPAAPPLPPIRRRPESFQLASNASSSTSTGPESPFAAPRPESPRSARSAPAHNLSRHVSLSSYPGRATQRERDHSPSAQTAPLAHIHRALADLQLKAQPRLDAARFKAEAGLAPRRGFVQHGVGSGRRWREDGETRLVDSSSEREESGESSGADVDVGPEDQPFGHKLARFNGGRDEMKWPAGEGWRPL